MAENITADLNCNACNSQYGACAAWMNSCLRNYIINNNNNK